MNSPFLVRGAIVDSWVEKSRRAGCTPRVVLQVAPQGRPRDIVIVEAETSVVPDHGLLQDLGENLCHGSPVAARGHMNRTGQLQATQIDLDR